MIYCLHIPPAKRHFKIPRKIAKKLLINQAVKPSFQMINVITTVSLQKMIIQTELKATIENER